MEAETTISTGQLVLYNYPNGRQYFAWVRRVFDDGVEVGFFDNEEPRRAGWEEIQTIDTFLDQQTRTWSRTRMQLTDHFYGRGFTRLTDVRVKEMKKALRDAGISFQPDVWPTARTRIKLRRDTSVVRQERRDTALLDLLPRWIDPFVLPSASRDPLGLQAPAERFVNEVLPGLTVFTSRAGYYGFLTWAIDQVNSRTGEERRSLVAQRELLNAMERTLALCEFIHHGRGDDTCRLIGQRSKTRVLQSANGDRFGVPSAILKNQNSAGAFRLYTTSLVSLGLIEEDPTLSIDAKLPYRLTQRGVDLAREFARSIDPSFVTFALGSKPKDRDVLRKWGKRLCFSSIARRPKYKSLMIASLFRANSLDAERRYRTAMLLFDAGLMNRPKAALLPELILEEESFADGEDAELETVTNLEVILYFYGLGATEPLRPLQTLAVFELLSLALTTLFRALAEALVSTTSVSLGGLAKRIAETRALAGLADVAMTEARPRTVRQLVADLMNASSDGDAQACAGIGGALLLRLLKDPLLTSVWPRLDQGAGEITSIVDRTIRSQMNRTFADALPELLADLVERHAVVSVRKNRQRWLFLDGEKVVKDDLQEMGFGLHALRFPQLASLVKDIGMSKEDLVDG